MRIFEFFRSKISRKLKFYTKILPQKLQKLSFLPKTQIISISLKKLSFPSKSHNIFGFSPSPTDKYATIVGASSDHRRKNLHHTNPVLIHFILITCKLRLLDAGGLIHRTSLDTRKSSGLWAERQSSLNQFVKLIFFSCRDYPVCFTYDGD
jgi:hypothetical protein